MGSVSHERLGAAQATGKRVFTPMMWSPLMSVRRSWFAIGSAPACASKNHDVFLVASPPTPSTRRCPCDTASARRRGGGEYALDATRPTLSTHPRLLDGVEAFHVCKIT